MKKNNTAPVAVFDSGVGGIGVLRKLVSRLPGENFIYFGDSANAPYGEKTAEEVKAVAEGVVLKLLDMGAKAIVIACNTATSAAAEYLRGKYADIPIIGMEPAVKPAAGVSDYPSVLVMATPLTLAQPKFRRLIQKYEKSARFTDVPCHGLVELVERGITDGAEMDALLHGILDGVLKENSPDAIVLGCTHYIHAEKSIQSVAGNGVRIFDGADGTARETERRLGECGILNDSGEKGHTSVYNSSGDEKMIELSFDLLYR